VSEKQVSCLTMSLDGRIDSLRNSLRLIEKFLPAAKVYFLPVEPTALQNSAVLAFEYARRLSYVSNELFEKLNAIQITDNREALMKYYKKSGYDNEWLEKIQIVPFDILTGDSLPYLIDKVNCETVSRNMKIMARDFLRMKKDEAEQKKTTNSNPGWFGRRAQAPAPDVDIVTNICLPSCTIQ